MSPATGEVNQPAILSPGIKFISGVPWPTAGMESFWRMISLAPAATVHETTAKPASHILAGRTQRLNRVGISDVRISLFHLGM